MYPKDVAKMSPCASLKCSPGAPTIDGKGANFGNRKENPRGKTSGQSGAFLKGLERERNERICVPLPARQRGIFETRPKWYKPLDKLGVVITLTPFMCHNSERIRARKRPCISRSTDRERRKKCAAKATQNAPRVFHFCATFHALACPLHGRADDHLQFIFVFRCKTLSRPSKKKNGNAIRADNVIFSCDFPPAACSFSCDFYAAIRKTNATLRKH